MQVSRTDAVLTITEFTLLSIHLSVFVCICRQIVAGSSIYTSAFFMIYLLRCVADYVTYFTGVLSIRLMIARILPPPADVIEAVMAYAIMFGVFVQLFLYAGVVANRYTAIAHPARHEQVWSGRSFAAILGSLLFLAAAAAVPFGMGIDEDGKIPLMAVATFAVTAGVCLSSVFFEVKTVLAYRRMNKSVKRQMKEELMLLGYAVLGLFMPIGLCFSFGIRLFCSECYWSMAAFPYLLDYMSLCEPVWLLLASRSLRNVYLRMFGCRSGKNQAGTVVFFTATATS